MSTSERLPAAIEIHSQVPFLRLSALQGPRIVSTVQDAIEYGAALLLIRDHVAYKDAGEEIHQRWTFDVDTFILQAKFSVKVLSPGSETAEAIVTALSDQLINERQWQAPKDKIQSPGWLRALSLIQLRKESVQLLRVILASRSLYRIHDLIDDHMLNPLNEIACAIFTRMYQLNDLDEIYIICHDYLGDIDQANVLREWVSKKKEKKE